MSTPQRDGRLRRSRGTPRIIAAAVLASTGPGVGKSLTLGTKDFTEEFILGQLYKQALQAKGYTVNYKENIGATEVIDKALTSGQIDAYPEYTGESVATVAKINKVVTSPLGEYALAKAFYAKRGQSMSNFTPFFDTDAIAVKKSYAQKYGLVSTADLKKVPHFTLGARPEFLNRQEGAAGMKSVYGVKNFTFKSLALGIQYQALDSGAVDAIDVFTTDPQLATGKYTVLKDPKNIFGFQNIALVINTPKLMQLGGPTFMNIINSVNALLTTPAVVTMNKAVAIDKQQPAAVAQAFLKANHLI
jgi:osmoprotectant transport system substrate-binding protein